VLLCDEKREIFVNQLRFRTHLYSLTQPPTAVADVLFSSIGASFFSASSFPRPLIEDGDSVGAWSDHPISPVGLVFSVYVICPLRGPPSLVVLEAVLNLRGSFFSSPTWTARTLA